MIYFLQYTLLDTFQDCGWMIQGRLWQPTTPCILTDAVDLNEWKNFGVNKLGNSQILDLSVVNVKGLAIQNYKNSATYNLAMLSQGSSVSNAVFVVNATIDCAEINPKHKYLSVSLFDSVFGAIRNVSVIGEVHLLNFNPDKFTQVRLSTFFGNIGLQDDERVYNGSMVSGVFSSLKFIVNESYEVKRTNSQDVVFIDQKDINKSITTADFLSRIQLVTCFDQAIKNGVNFTLAGDKESFDLTTPDNSGFDIEVPYAQINTTGLDIPIPKVPVKSLEKMKAQYKFVNLTLIDPLSNKSYVQNTTIGFDYSISTNAIDDFYTRSLIKQKDIEKEIVRMEMGFYSFAGVKQDLINPAQPDLKVFNSPTKAVAVWNGGVSICEDGLLFDVLSKSCVSSCKDGSARYQSACLAACPKNFFFVTILNVNHCYLKCPTQLGYVPPTDASSKCRLCSISQSITESGCVSPSETAGMVKFGSGYFAQCPDGLTSDCKEPTSCPDGQYFVNVSGHPLSLANNRELFSHCSMSLLAGAGMLRLMTFDGTDKKLTNVFTWSCPFGTRFANQTCLTSDKYTPKAADCDIQDIKQIPNKVNGGGIACDAICMNSLVNSSGACSDSCVGPLYKQTAFGACNPCQSEAYDKGTYFQEQTKMCALFCDYYTVAKPKETAPKICKVSCSANEKIVNRIDSITKKANKQCVGNCSDVDMLEVNGICVSTCPNLLDVTGKICVIQCGSDETIDLAKKQCTKCATQTLDDGSITPNCVNCKYFDTRYDPPMCVDSCKIYYTKEGKQYCVDKCPSGTYLNTRNLTSTCVASCAVEERYVGANNTCVDSCKIYTIVGSEQVCSDFCADEQLIVDDKVICYPDCGTQISSSSGCVDECPAGTYLYLKLCLAKCPKSFTEFQSKCIQNNQKNSNWIYIVIFVTLFIVISASILVFYLIRRRNLKNNRRIKKINHIHKDTDYYARRVQVSEKTKQNTSKLNGSQLIDSRYTNDTCSKLGTSSNSDSSASKQKKKRLVKIKEYDGSIPDVIPKGQNAVHKGSKTGQKQTKLKSTQLNPKNAKEAFVW
ncbi:Conserved_hypothetical protein [Hexamita inflata]|uniref:Uncharacterized protein n=1 Tax=Hexamita inflata TaxID=28002 RepID=A0AA86UST0_9EUKA|nr:Conserved hypothetical protein [Hexamita inflata]